MKRRRRRAERRGSERVEDETGGRGEKKRNRVMKGGRESERKRGKV